MVHAARAHVESLLRTRKLDVTLTSTAPWNAPPRDMAATGLDELDAALGGGLCRGDLSELVGPRSAGRTTILCRALATAAERGEAVALIDTHDRFDPESAGAAGLDLTRLLWVREVIVQTRTRAVPQNPAEHSLEFMFAADFIADHGDPSEEDQYQVAIEWVRPQDLPTLRFYPQAVVPALVSYLNDGPSGEVYLGDID